MNRIALALLICATWAATAAAMEEPAPSKQDSRIRSAAYTQTDVIHITSTSLNPVQIVLQDGEKIESFAGLLVGTISKPDEIKNIHDWLIRFSKNSIVLQPLKAEPPSMLFVDTLVPDQTMRHYRFQLDTRDGDPSPSDPDAYMAVNMIYPSVLAAQRKALAEEAAIRQAKAEAIAEQQAAESRLIQAPVASGRNWRYEAQNINAYDNSCMTIGPERIAGISDDGLQTMLLFAPHAALPVPYVLDQDGKESVVQHSQQEVPDGLVMTLHTVVPRLILRRGGRACAFTNMAYDPAGHSPGTGTVSTAVVREVRQ
jgi:type IV secretion system protein VirB9